MKRLIPALALVLLATGCGNDEGGATAAAGSLLFAGWAVLDRLRPG